MQISKKQSGFTLIELISVLAIMGILAAVAVPKFLDLTSSARGAVARSTATSLSSAASLNYAASIARSTGLEPNKVVSKMLSCTDTLELLSDKSAFDATNGDLVVGQTIANDNKPTDTPASAGTDVTCTVKSKASNATATYQFIAVNAAGGTDTPDDPDKK